ncbi:MAG TPA: protein-disulfide reductase DsbD domain-containing protein [Stellaceae bacterium]|nr:protein-disulfide reductase DsbD domain-containing protein [Stellaceae bacterium]
MTLRRAGLGAILGGLIAGLAAVSAIAAPVSAAGPGVPLDPVAARLVAESGSVVPGKTLWVDLHLDIIPGWHVYWRNPGDSGLPTEIAWELPAGFRAGEIAWPAPERFVLGTIGNYGYEGTADLLVPIAAPAGLQPGGAVHLAANANWLVCSDICIPGEAKLALDLPVSLAAVTPDPSVASLFAAVRERLPQTAGFATRFAVLPRELRLFVPEAALAGIDKPSAAFFPYDGNVVDAAAAPKEERRADGLAVVLTRMSGPAATLPSTLRGVLVVRGAGGAERAYSIDAPRAAGAADDEAGVGWWQALALAVLGGIVLNLMPCVFPVLSLKLLGLAGSAERANEWHQGAAYAAGVILSFAALGGALLGLRAGGAAIGWGFQLQSPVVVGLLAYLLFAMGLSLSGVAEFGAGLAGIGSRFAGGAGLFGAFATGILATTVATPCTAPFMGAALGFALIAPAPLALLIFVALGSGLALPVVLATAIPGIARRLPRPGAWMVWFKQLLAFPLYGTVAWLIWVLIQEVGPTDALAGLFGLVVVGFAVWIFGRTRANGPAGRRLGAGFAFAGIAAALILAATLATAAAPAAGEAAGAQRDNLGYEKFSTARLDQLVAAHQRVFVNLTAAWCITCLVNEHIALASQAVRRAFAQNHVVVLKGDWTRRDPEITAFLQEFGRSGVPLYLFYDQAGTPTVLPQILTEATVLDALRKSDTGG